MAGKDGGEEGRSHLGLLDRLAEESNPPSQRQSRQGLHRDPAGSEDGDAQSGSAALGGDDAEQASLTGKEGGRCAVVDS